MPSRAPLVAIALLAGSVAGGTAAQGVYRCGDDGRSYSQQPCAEGRAVAVDDPRGADARREGEAAAARQARAAELLAQERRRREAGRPRAASLGRSASGDPSFAPTAPAKKSASAKAGSRKAASRKAAARTDAARTDARGDARGSAAVSSTAPQDAAR
jgi:hypothetical protein